MNKLKKSLSVLLTLVMLFTTLCFFVIPETEVKANAANTVYKYRIVMDNNDETGNTQYSHAYLRIKSNNGYGPDIQTITLGSYGDNDGNGFAKKDVTYENSLTDYPGYFPYELYIVYKGKYGASIEVTAKISVYDYSTSSYKEIHSQGFDMDGDWHVLDKNQVEQNRTITVDASWYPYVDITKVTVSGGDTIYIPDNATSVTQNVTISAADQYGVEWVNAPTNITATNGVTVSATNTKTPSITYNNANTDYSSTITTTWQGAHSKYSTVNAPVTKKVYVQRTMTFDNDPLFKLSDWTTIGGSCEITNLTDKSFTATSTTGDGNTGFSHRFAIKPNTIYVLSADIDYVPLNADEAFDVYFQPLKADGTSLEGTEIIEGCHTEGSVYVSSTGHKSDVKKVRMVFKTTADTALAAIRFDANNVGNVINVSNIKFIELPQENFTPVTMTIQGNKKFKEYTAPVPSATGFTFDGWYLDDLLIYDNTGKFVYSVNTELYVNEYLSYNTLYSMNLTSSWTENKYNIRYDANLGTGATIADTTDVAYTSKIALPANTYTRTGYVFTGWNTAKDGSGTAIADKATVSKLSAVNGATVTLYAQWVPNNYTINFNANTGTGSMSGVTATYDKDTQLPENTFTKEGYSFKGWNTAADGNGTAYADKATVKNLAVSGATTLYAQWSINQYTITYDTDGGTAIPAVTQNYGTAVSAPAAPTKTGYTFAGWDTVIPSTMPAENMTIKAKWNINQYTITFNSNGGSDVAPITQDYGTAVTAPTAPTKTGYTFDGWDALPETMPAENITVNAKWEANEYTIVYDTVGGSAVASTPAVYDAEATLAAAPTKTGYVFKGWKLGDTTYEAGATVKNLAADGSVTVTAVWEANTYTVTFDKNDAAATGTMGEQSFTYDVAKNLNALGFTKEGWHFVEWNTAADGKGTGYADKAEAVNLTADVNGEVTLYAIWTINLYDVTFKFNCVTGEEKTVTRTDIPHGTAFDTLLPTKEDGYATTYYKGADTNPDTNTDHYNFTAWENAVEEITADVTFVAKYEAEQHLYFDNGSEPAKCEIPGLDKKACDCGFTYEKVTDALKHDWKETSRVVDCVNGDLVDYKCTLCQDGTKQERLAATGHTFSAVTEKKAPTCTDTGLKAYKTCEKCKLYFAEAADTMAEGASDLTGFIIEAKGHTYGIWIAEIPAKCETEGTRGHYNCSACNVNFDVDYNVLTNIVIPAKGHNYGEWIDEIPADCENNGTLGHYNCSVCGKNFDSEKAVLDSLVIPALEHDLETVPGQIPTCENIGWDEYQRCTRDGCDYSTYVEIPATGHAYSGTVKTPATCTADGVMTYTCSNDASHTYEEAIKAQGHKFINNVAYKAPECLVDGNYAYKQCSECNKYFAAAEEAFSSVAHESAADFVITKTGHKEATKKELLTDATCQVKGDYNIITYCSVCNVTIKTEKFEGEFLPHDYSVETKNYPRTAATCVDYATYYLACSMCGKSSEDDGAAYYEDEAAGYNPAIHTTNETHIVDDKDSTCYEVGFTGNKLYNCCNALFEKGTEIEKTAHTPAEAVEENRVGATCYREGSYDMVVYCSVCEAAGITKELSRETETIEKIAHTPAAAKVENTVDSTCYAEGSYDEVVYCSVEACKHEISRTEKTIEKKAHTPAAPAVKNKNDSTCYAEGSYDEVVYCSVEACKHEISRTAKTIEKKAHTPAEAVEENRVGATCYREGSYDEVIYCSVCEAAGKTEELSRETKTIAKIAHTPATAVRENVKNATCATEGSYDEVVYCSVEACNYEISRTEKEIATVPHNPGETVIENKVPATSSKDGSYDEVTYCTFCGTETSREKKTYTAASVLPGLPEDGKVNVDLGENGESDKTLDEILGADGNDYESSNPDITVDENGNITADKDGETVITVTTPDGEIIEVPVTVRTVKTITFVMKDKTEKVNAYNGDTVALPDVADYTAADGFIHKFKNWDKPVAVVNGDATYTAVYTEPADWSVLDDLEDTLNEILDGGLVEDSILEENKAKIETVLNQIENINKDRNTLDKSEQSRVDFVAGEIGGLLDVIYPDAGSTLVIEGASTAYAGTILDLKAVKMPLGAVLTDAQWTSSDEKVVFFSNGKLYAIGTGTVTLTAKRGILEAKKTITIVEGGNTRGINFTSINNTHFIIEDYAAVYNSAIIYWSDDFDLRFRVRVYQSFMFDDYIVYINGQEAQPNAEGYFVVPAGSGDVRVTIAGAMIDTGAGEGETVTKWSFWEWLLNFFRKIIAFFQDLFGIN